MLDIEDFDVVFPDNLSYSQGLAMEIHQCRKTLGGRTFFERLLDLLQIKFFTARKTYPPTGETLRELHDRIIKSPIALHYKHCLLLYLLKDLSSIHQSRTDTDIASTFARSVHLDPKFWTFIEGLWSLDHLQFDTAVNHLTHPSIIPTFPDEILLVLLNHSKEQSGPNNGDILPLAYYNCANPPLVGQEVKAEFVRYMTMRDVTETFYWIRGRQDGERGALWEVFVEQILEPGFEWRSASTSHSASSLIGTGGAAQGYKREDRMMEFVGLPFEDEEEEWIERFLTEGKGRNLKNAVDTLAVRRVASGKGLGVVARDGAVGSRGKRIEGVSWDLLKEGIIKGLGPRKTEDEDEGRFVF